MPLKHHAETAYMIFLALVTCAVGFLIALLPHLPLGMPYWAILFVGTLLYPLLLARTFKQNRADYEFRMLHWFPFGMVVLWLSLQLLGDKARLLHILQLGFFFLWSLPLVVLGLSLLILFSVHVIRRQKVRVTTLSIMLALFTVGAVASEAMGWDSKLQRTVYPKNLVTKETAGRLYAGARHYLGMLSGTSSGGQGSSSSALSGSSMTSAMSRSHSSVMIAAMSSSKPQLMMSSKPSKLPASGPESFAILAATMLALYMGTVHGRAKRRV